VRQLIERYLAEHVSRLAPDSASDYRSRMMTYVMPVWGRRKVIDIGRSDVDQLLIEIAKGRARPHKKKTKQKRVKSLQPARPTPGRANRVGCAIRKMSNLAIRWEMRTDNPAAGFISNPENPRERFLNIDEITKLSELLDKHPNQLMANIIRLSHADGCSPWRGVERAINLRRQRSNEECIAHRFRGRPSSCCAASEAQSQRAALGFSPVMPKGSPSMR
jgi:hypothetical protein